MKSTYESDIRQEVAGSSQRKKGNAPNTLREMAAWLNKRLRIVKVLSFAVSAI